MSGERREAADSQQAARYREVRHDLVHHFQLMSTGSRVLRQALEQVPAWREATGDANGESEFVPLWRVVTGMRAAAARNPTLALVLASASRHPRSTWSVASQTVDDACQWRRDHRQQWARASCPSSPAPSLGNRSRGGRRP